MGRINISIPELWIALMPLCEDVECAFEKIGPDIFNRQRHVAKQAIAADHRHGMVTAISAYRYSLDLSKRMSAHSDRSDYTILACHRDGEY